MLPFATYKDVNTDFKLGLCLYKKILLKKINIRKFFLNFFYFIRCFISFVLVCFCVQQINLCMMKMRDICCVPYVQTKVNLKSASISFIQVVVEHFVILVKDALSVYSFFEVKTHYQSQVLI